MEYQLHPLSDNGVIISFGDMINETNLKRVQTISDFLDTQPFHWMIEYIPAFTTITIFYDPLKVLENESGKLLPYDIVLKHLHAKISALMNNQLNLPREMIIPVCYGGELGPDLEFVARYNQITPDEVIQIHSSGEYIVYMIGFAPGFPYLGGMSEKISTPRKKTPRIMIPSGSVGIAGNQTGIYPIETPGGWQLIGQTPLKLFQPEGTTPSLLKAGDRIRFLPISYEEFFHWEELA